MSGFHGCHRHCPPPPPPHFPLLPPLPPPPVLKLWAFNSNEKRRKIRCVVSLSILSKHCEKQLVSLVLSILNINYQIRTANLFSSPSTLPNTRNISYIVVVAVIVVNMFFQVFLLCQIPVLNTWHISFNFHDNLFR